MKWYLILTFLLLSACSARNKKCPAKSKGGTTAEAVQQATVRNDDISSEEEMPDSVSPSVKWIYSLLDGVFPSQYTNGALIKGWDTDGKGHFYVVEGSPCRLVGYQDTTMLCTRKLEPYRGYSGLVKLVGDSVYIE